MNEELHQALYGTPPPAAPAVESAAPAVEPAQPQAAPAEPAQPVAATPPAEPQSPAAPAQPQAPDYAAYLAEQFGVNDPAAIKERLAAAERVADLEKNQRTAADLALQQWIADKPAEAMEYFRLQAADFDAMPGKDVMFEAFQRSAEVEGLPADVVRTLFEADYHAKYGVLDFADDPDQAAAVKVAQARHTQAERAARVAMNGVKQAAALPVPAAAPAAKTPEQVAADKAEAQRELDQFFAAGAKVPMQTGDLAYELAVTDRATFEQALDVYAHIEAQLMPNGQYDQAAHFRLAALLSQDPAAAAIAAHQAKQPAAIPVATLTNPPAAPAPGTPPADWRQNAINAAAAAAQQPTNNARLYGFN